MLGNHTEVCWLPGSRGFSTGWMPDGILSTMAGEANKKCTHVIFDLDGLMLGKFSVVPAFDCYLLLQF